MSSRRQQKDQRRRNLDAFKHRIEAADRSSIVVDSPAEEKLTEALIAFVEPYVNAMSTHDDLAKLYRVAVAAWNLALMPPDQQSDALDRELPKLLPGGSDDDVQLLRGFIEHLIAQKALLFPSDRRSVFAFELVERKDDHPLLRVASGFA